MDCWSNGILVTMIITVINKLHGFPPSLLRRAGVGMTNEISKYSRDPPTSRSRLCFRRDDKDEFT